MLCSSVLGVTARQMVISQTMARDTQTPRYPSTSLLLLVGGACVFSSKLTCTNFHQLLLTVHCQRHKLLFSLCCYPGAGRAQVPVLSSRGQWSPSGFLGRRSCRDDGRRSAPSALSALDLLPAQRQWSHHDGIRNRVTLLPFCDLRLRGSIRRNRRRAYTSPSVSGQVQAQESTTARSVSRW